MLVLVVAVSDGLARGVCRQDYSSRAALRVHVCMQRVVVMKGANTWVRVVRAIYDYLSLNVEIMKGPQCAPIHVYKIRCREGCNTCMRVGIAVCGYPTPNEVISGTIPECWKCTFWLPPPKVSKW